MPKPLSRFEGERRVMQWIANNPEQRTDVAIERIMHELRLQRTAAQFFLESLRRGELVTVRQDPGRSIYRVSLADRGASWLQLLTPGAAA